jgi:anti-anti-sigma factor
MPKPTVVPIEGTDIVRIVIGADRLDVYNAPALRELSVGLVRGLKYRQILDLEGVESADSYGLGVIVGMENRVLGHGGALVLVNVGAGIAATLNITGLDKRFVIACDLASAVAFFNPPPVEEDDEPEPEGGEPETYTGNRAELARLLDSDNEHLMDGLVGWQFAAVARALAEAGAVHPGVHTPTRIVNYLERHGWERVDSPAKPAGEVFWSPPSPNELRWVHPTAIELDAPLCDDLPDYADIVRVVVNRIAWAERGDIRATDEARTAILLEVAQMPDEVAW